ncbi:MAG: carboxypeptidase-like regulatory domain-containing protein, partial [Tannerellaceae bacterium]|nr:carboxypeptidase-like regulatory domain-containing protein [Tannerellaceae bacterium]
MTNRLYFLLKTKKKSLVSLFLMIFAVSLSPVNAQQVQIDGRVLDTHTNEPIIGSTVLLIGEKKGTVTDENGNFSIQAESFPTTLSVSYIGYGTKEIDIYEYLEP